MDRVIKEGSLRVLISESTCDVILSCKDHRLMAHKLILSIASPVFRELLRKNSTDSTTVLIIPDISGSIMSTILDYIYTGTTVVYSNSLQEFLSVARFLQIAVDTRNVGSVLESLQKVEDVKKLETEGSETRYKAPLSEKERANVQNIEYCKIDVKKQDTECSEATKETEDSVEQTINLPNKLVSEPNMFQSKVQKQLPDLLPISSETFRKNSQRRMCTVVVPSPWCQRSDRGFLEDPRAMSLRGSEKEVQNLHVEDTNNNLQLSQNSESPKGNPKTLDSIIRHLYLNNADSGRQRTTDKTTKNSATLGEDFSKKRNCTAQHSESYQKNTFRILEAYEPPSFSFSRSLAALKRSGKRSESSDSKLSDTSGFPRTKCTENRTHRTLNTDYSLEHHISDFAQNLSVSRKCTSSPQASPTSIPPSNTVTRVSPSISNFPLFSPNNLRENPKTERKKSRRLTRLEETSNSNDNSNFNDVSNDNSLSNDSSGDEKKEDETSTKKKSYKCEDCGKCFSQLRNYKYHRSVHEGTKEFSAKCSECGKMFNDRGYLSSHMKIHRDRKEYACPHCPKRFNQRVAYNMHLRIHTGVKPHECPTCGKSFSRKMLLKQHQRVHTGERPYTCPECGKTFADRSNMSLHARLHTGVKPYGCSLCPKSFTKKHHLKTHMNFHTGLKPYTCENCGLAFSQSSNMRTHYKKCVLKDAGKGTKTESLSSADNNSS